MKRTLLFTMCMLASLMMSAQESNTDYFDYVPLVDAGKSWIVARSTPGQDAIDVVQCYIPLNVERVNGKAYYKMKAIINNTTETGTYLIREEDRKVYLFDTDTQREYLMFDYSLKAGDTYETYSYEYQKMVKYEVLSVSDYEKGPGIFSYVYDEEAKSTTKHRRYLRKWVVQSDVEKILCLEPKTWIEGIGSLEGPFANLNDASYSLDHLAYVEHPYLPFAFHESIGKLWFGCNMPTGEGNDYSEDKRHQLTYELEGNRLHVYGKVLTHGGANNYAYFIEEPTDDSSVRKLHFKIKEIEPLPDPLPDSDGLYLHTTDFYAEGFPPAFDYIIIDNQGVEHPVINKNLQPAYRPFVEDGKVWKIGGIGSNPVQIVDYYYFDGDTIINGKTCKQMMRQRLVSPEHPNYDYISQEPSLSYVGAWYEEDKKVYTYDTTYHQFTMMYDFSLEDNGTFQTNGQSYVIGPKQSGGIKGFKGVHRSVRLTADGESIYSTPWLEGVGGLDCPTTNVYPGYVDPAWFLMACVVGDEVIYLNDEYEDGATPDVIGARKQRIDFTHIIKTQPKTRMRQQGGDEDASETSPLYGEYNERKLDINLAPLDEAYLVLIADETGKAVYEKTINAGNIVGLNIDISTYVKGHYTVTVENSQESFTGEFEVKTTGIEEVRSDRRDAKIGIFDLQGRRLTDKPNKVVYIQSGRLVVK